MLTSGVRSLQRLVDSVARKQDRFWRDLPPWALVTVLLAVFFTFSSFGFLTDLVALDNGQRFSSTIYHAVVAGSCAAASAWTAMRRVRWLPFAVVFQLALIFPLRNLVNQAGAESTTELTLATRLMFDMVGSLVGVGLGYVLFIVFFVRAGARLADIQAELRLARVIHQTLVPPIACRLGRFEF